MSVIISPLLTEKSAAQMDTGLYVLRVMSSATKTEISSEIKRHFDLDVVSVRIVNLPSKIVTFKRRKGVRGEVKKAYIQLKKGQKLPGFELPKQKEDQKNTEQIADKNEEKK